jgi:hypothetical protein
MAPPNLVVASGPRSLFGRDRLRAREGERDAVAEPPGAEVHKQRDAKRERHRGLSEEEPRAEDACFRFSHRADEGTVNICANEP